jgi:hypothetical protein
VHLGVRVVISVLQDLSVSKGETVRAAAQEKVVLVGQVNACHAQNKPVCSVPPILTHARNARRTMNLLNTTQVIIVSPTVYKLIVGRVVIKLMI